MTNLTLALLPETYTICRLPAGVAASPCQSGGFSLAIQAVEETTLVCTADQAPEGAQVDPGWRCLRIVQSFDFSTPGILASVLQPLAQARIGIFASSTFSTDYVLVKAADLPAALSALRAAGHDLAQP